LDIRAIKHNSKIFDKNYVILFAIFCIFLYPEVLTHTSFYRFLRLFQTVATFFCVLFFIFNFINSKLLIGINIFFLYYFIVTGISSNYLNTTLFFYTHTFPIIALSLYFVKINPRIFWKCISDYYFIILLINSLLTLLMPHGVLTIVGNHGTTKEIFLLGEQNQIIPVYLFGLFFSLIYFYLYKEQKMRILILFVITWLSSLYYGSVTSLIGLFFFTILTLVNYLYFAKRTESMCIYCIVTNFKNYLIGFIGIIVLNISLVVFRVQRLLEPIFEMFNKDATFSTRTQIWDEALKFLYTSPIIGYGAFPQNRYLFINDNYFSPHNLFLQLFLMGGLILFSVFIYLMQLSISDLAKIKVPHTRNTISIFLVVFFLMSVVEIYGIPKLFFLLAMPMLISQTHEHPDFIK